MEIKAFLDRCWPDALIAFKDLGEGEYAAVVRMGFNDRIIRGSTDDYSGYDRFWCYELGKAQPALEAWIDQNEEPQGWKKNYRGQYSEEFLRKHPHMTDA